MIKIKEIPISSGIYIFKDKKKKPLYIGKAVNLRSRVKSYFDKQTKNPRIEQMLKEAHNIDFQETDSEIEALILESNLIKKYNPPFNIMLRDDKSYSYVAFTDEDFPKIFVIHKNYSSTTLKPYSSILGPFTSASELRTMLKTLRKLIPYCTCKQKHNRPCLNAHIERCLGFCCLENKSSKLPARSAVEEAQSYLKNIKIIKDLLSGKKTSIIKKFPNVFENIRVLKEISNRENNIKELQKVFKLPTLPIRIEGYDISNVQGNFATGSMVVFENGQPNKTEYRKFKIKAPSSPDDILMLDEMLSRRFSHSDWQKPDAILIDGGIAQFNVAKRYFSPILSIAKGKQEIFSTTIKRPTPIKNLPESVKNLILYIDSEAHRFAINYYRKLHRKSVK